MGVWEYGRVGGVFPPYSHTPILPHFLKQQPRYRIWYNWVPEETNLQSAIRNQLLVARCQKKVKAGPVSTVKKKARSNSSGRELAKPIATMSKAGL